MTIASQISRLQTDKECMRQAIIDKGVDVAASVSFDDYAACIAEISSGPKVGYVDLLVVGGGGSGGANSSYGPGGGGGAGGFIQCNCFPLNQTEDTKFAITVGEGGGDTRCYGCKGGDSCFGSITAYGGGGGGYCTYCCNCEDGASGGGGSAYSCDRQGCIHGGCPGKSIYGGQGNNGGAGIRLYGYGCAGGGGGGAGGLGGDGSCCCLGSNCGYGIGGNGGVGKCSSISGTNRWYSGGGGAGAYGNPSNLPARGGCGGCGGGGAGGGCGSGSLEGGDATYYGGGGGGSACASCCTNGKGCQGVVIIRYHTDGSDGICCTSSGGCKYTCGAYTIHCFVNIGVTEYFYPVFK